MFFQGLYLRPLWYPSVRSTLVKFSYYILLWGHNSSARREAKLPENKIIYYILQIGNGMLRALHYEPGAVADIIPVDLVVNMLITAAWFTVLSKPEKVLIYHQGFLGKNPWYHSTSGATNPVTWGEVCKINASLSLDWQLLRINALFH